MGNRRAARLSPRYHNYLVSLHSQYILCIQFQEVILYDAHRSLLVVDMVEAAEPAVAVHPALDGVQPSFSGLVHQRLLEARDKGVPGLILEGHGVGENVIHLPARRARAPPPPDSAGPPGTTRSVSQQSYTPYLLPAAVPLPVALFLVPGQQIQPPAPADASVDVVVALSVPPDTAAGRVAC